MLRIVYQLAEARAELRRIGDRLSGTELETKKEAVEQLLSIAKQKGGISFSPFDPTQASRPIQVAGSDLDAAYQQISQELLHAIQLSCQNLNIFHQRKIPKSWVHFGEQENVIGRRYTPVDRVGIYVPGGEFPALSQVLSLCIPAKVAGVAEVIMTTPPSSEGQIHPALLVAAQEAGINEIYRLQGATAIAAMAYGMPTINKVDLIVGSGGLEVTLAKRYVQGTVGIDSVVDASELMVVADSSSNSNDIAAQLLSQAEQDPLAAAILLTLDPHLAEAVQSSVSQQLTEHPHRLSTEKAIAHHGLIAVIESIDIAIELVNQFAPQTLVLAFKNSWDQLEQVRHAGTIILGGQMPRAIGDYLGGVSTDLPGGSTARFGSPVGVEFFLKSSNLLQYSPEALSEFAAALQILSQAEGKLANAWSFLLRNP